MSGAVEVHTGHWPTITCRVCEKPVSFDCRAHYVAEVNRLRRVLGDIAERDCSYDDNCPVFGSRHGRCDSCIARDALAVPRSTSASLPADREK